jgi:hypothetical protein
LGNALASTHRAIGVLPAPDAPVSTWPNAKSDIAEQCGSKDERCGKLLCFNRFGATIQGFGFSVGESSYRKETSIADHPETAVLNEVFKKNSGRSFSYRGFGTTLSILAEYRWNTLTLSGSGCQPLKRTTPPRN